MRLKRIEMAGFKSFVDPTRIELGDGITAVVGPNGCGKSNIIDAIRWVLGEHSAKQLRGSVMDDLIFQGSETRPPVSLCDVELTFAIRPGQLPSPYHELEEISVRRRMSRESGSDAYINGKMVRLKDVIDLFLDTGISSYAYAVVEQGSIARMITAKPEERRLMLEEAAGIMKYRTRRRETERKMDATRQNLERVMDLLEEVRSQCRSLRQQASRAERFKALQEEWQALKSTSLGLRYRQISESCRQIERELEKARLVEAQAAQEQTAIERELNEKRQEMIRYEAEIQAAQDAVRAAELRQAEIQRQIEQQAGHRRLLAERRKNLEQRLAENRERIRQVTKEHDHLSGQLEEFDASQLEHDLHDMEEKVSTALEEYQNLGNSRDQALARFERLKNESQSIEKRHSFAETALNRLIARKQSIREQQNQLFRQISEMEEQLAHLEEQVRQARRNWEHAETHRKNQLAILEESRKRRDVLEIQLEQDKGRARYLAGEIQELSARLNSSDIEEELRQLFRNRGLLWVDEELQVPAGFDLAVAAVLKGESADAIWAGEAPSTALASLAPEIAEAPVAIFMGNSSPPVNMSLADTMDLDESHPLYRLFCNVAVVDNIIDAPALLKKQPQCQCVVSRDGWLLGRDGWLIPPSKQNTAHKLKLKRQLQSLEQELGKASRQVERSERELLEAAENQSRQQQLWEKAQLTAIEARGQLSESEADVVRLRASLADMLALRERLQSEYNELVEDEKEAQGILAGLEEFDTESLVVAEMELEDLTRKRQTAEQILARERASLAATSQELALRRQAHASIRQDMEQLAEERKRLWAQISVDEQHLKQVLEELTANDEDQDLDDALSKAAEEVDDAYLNLNEKRQVGSRLQQILWDTEQRQQKSRQKLKQAGMHSQQIQVRLTAEQTRLEDLSADILRQCNMEAGELVQRLESMEEIPDADEVMEHAGKLEERLSRFGPVNLLAIEEFQQASERESFLAAQSADLEASLQTLADTISRIDRTTRQRFQQAFERTNAIFRETFPRLFGGGRAELQLSSDDLLSAGVEVVAQPPGKRLQDVSLLSGGEKALTAVALVFSIFRMKPAPFCILDEVDAPLDDANVGRFGELMRELATDVQFINVTHNKISMQLADHLIGVSMPEPGVSRIVGVELDR